MTASTASFPAASSSSSYAPSASPPPVQQYVLYPFAPPVPFGGGVPMPMYTSTLSMSLCSTAWFLLVIGFILFWTWLRYFVSQKRDEGDDGLL